MLQDLHDTDYSMCRGCARETMRNPQSKSAFAPTEVEKPLTSSDSRFRRTQTAVHLWSGQGWRSPILLCLEPESLRSVSTVRRFLLKRTGQEDAKDAEGSSYDISNTWQGKRNWHCNNFAARLKRTTHKANQFLVVRQATWLCSPTNYEAISFFATIFWGLVGIIIVIVPIWAPLHRQTQSNILFGDVLPFQALLHKCPPPILKALLLNKVQALHAAFTQHLETER